MYDLIVKNGEIITETGKKRLDIGIQNGVITKLGCSEEMGEAREILDARDRYIFPGGIDAHVHMNDPGADEMEDWIGGTLSAASGGITVVADMPIDNIPATINRQTMERKLEHIKGRSYTDYRLWGGLTTNNLKDVEGMLEAGAVGLKAFLTDSGSEELKKTSAPVLLEAMKVSAKKEFPLVIHAEDDEINKYYSKIYSDDPTWDDWSNMHPEISEWDAIVRCLLFAKATNAKIHIAHISSAKSVSLIRAAKEQGIRVTCETCPHYLLFSEKDYTKNGALLKCSPPVRNEENRRALWKALERGDIDIISSDHSPNPAKSRSDNVNTAWSGIAGIGVTLLSLYSEGVCKHRCSLEQLVKVTSVNASKLLGIDRKKGKIALGKDADFIIFNPHKTTVFRDERGKMRNSIYQNMSFQGKIENTFLRGYKIEHAKPQGQHICR